MLRPYLGTALAGAGVRVAGARTGAGAGRGTAVLGRIVAPLRALLVGGPGFGPASEAKVRLGLGVAWAAGRAAAAVRAAGSRVGVARAPAAAGGLDRAVGAAVALAVDGRVGCAVTRAWPAPRPAPAAPPLGALVARTAAAPGVGVRVARASA